MLGSRPRRKPTFLWQGALILLPVVVMCTVALLAIRRDKAAVEQEARQRAGEVASQLATGLAQRVPVQLAAYDLFSFTRLKHYQELAKAKVLPRDSYDSRLAEWQAANPGLHPEEVLPNRLSFEPDGVLVWPPDYSQPPKIPSWFLGLSTKQRQAWDALVNSEFATSDPTNLDLTLREFLNCNPPPEARVTAAFISQRSRLVHETGTNAVLALQRASGEYTRVHNESGLPLLSLVAAEALRLVHQRGTARPSLSTDLSNAGDILHQILAWIIDEPSLLSPALLQQAQEWLDSGAIEREKFQQAIQAARTIWSSQERVHELAEDLRHHWFLSGTTTNFWLESSGDSYFCRAEPDRLTASTNKINDAPDPNTNNLTSVRVYPKTVIERAFANALQDLSLPIPEYFSVHVRLENESLLSENAASHARSGNDLAETRARFAPMPISIAAASLPTGNQQPIPQPQAPAAEPQLTVQVRLIDPSLLFATQRQRTRIFGALILASALAALVGLIAAYRSFRRQLRLSELKSNFVSSVSHELRAPIASVRLMAESLELGKIADPKKQHQYFHFIVQECRRLSSLIENVLDFSRIEQGRKQFEFEPTDIVALAQQTVKLMEAYATERQVALTLAPAALGSQFQLLADGKAIQQALINLIDNAVKHSPKGQSVTIGWEVLNGNCVTQATNAQRTAQSDTRLALWVEDHGEGIPAEEHEKIFERFYRLGSELRRQTQGVGIGLSIVKHVIEAHGGRVLVRSVVGQGSRFTIELPLALVPQKSDARNPNLK